VVASMPCMGLMGRLRPMGPVNQTANLVLPAFPRFRQSFETPEASSGKPALSSRSG
jgi:hypothetical protein